MEYLDFEEPIKDLNEQIEKCKNIGNESSVDVTDTCELLESKLLKTKKEIYGNLNAWQRVQLSRHPSRPYTLDYIKTPKRFITQIDEKGIQTEKITITK